MMGECIFDLVREDYIMAVEMNGIGIFREDLIRCRDCLHSEKNDDMMFCRMASTGQWQYAPVNPDGFCAWAEKMEGCAL